MQEEGGEGAENHQVDLDCGACPSSFSSLSSLSSSLCSFSFPKHAHHTPSCFPIMFSHRVLCHTFFLLPGKSCPTTEPEPSPTAAVQNRTAMKRDATLPFCLHGAIDWG